MLLNSLSSIFLPYYFSMFFFLAKQIFFRQPLPLTYLDSFVGTTYVHVASFSQVHVAHERCSLSFFQAG